MTVRKGLVSVMAVLILSLALPIKASSEFRIRAGVLSHWDSLFGNCGYIIGSDYLLNLKETPFGIAGGLEYTPSAKNTFYSNTDWKDMAITLSIFYYPTLKREVYLGTGLEYHWLTKDELYLYSNYRSIRKDSGLGLHLIGGFNIGKSLFLECKINSVGIGYRNKGGISLQLGGKF